MRGAWARWSLTEAVRPSPVVEGTCRRIAKVCDTELGVESGERSRSPREDALAVAGLVECAIAVRPV